MAVSVINEVPTPPPPPAPSALSWAFGCLRLLFHNINIVPPAKQARFSRSVTNATETPKLKHISNLLSLTSNINDVCGLHPIVVR